MLSSLRIGSDCILLIKYNQTAAEEEKQQHQHVLQILDELNGGLQLLGGLNYNLG